MKSINLNINLDFLRNIHSIKFNKNEFFAFIDSHIINYPTPINLNYLWSFGSIAGICLVIQIITGIFLAMHYTSHIDYAFSSVEHIMGNVKNGWFLRYIHANGASMFFIIVYCHIFRGIYYGSYMRPRELLWASGVIIFLIMMATAFMGYVLPWGQMSFWGATVITNLFSAIPIIGRSIVEWLWGGFSVGNATLNRFFSLHYLLPFLLVGLVIIHLALLHKNGSNNPLGTGTAGEYIPFYPYFYVKDLFAFFSFMVVFAFFVFFYPNILGHPDNYIPANPLSTPPHIVPEWYFLPFYAILRSIPDKLGGVIAMISAILVLLLLPFINQSELRSTKFRPGFGQLYWLLVIDFLILGWIGQKPVESPYIEIGMGATFFYFFFLLVLIPMVGRLETTLRYHGLDPVGIEFLNYNGKSDPTVWNVNDKRPNKPKYRKRHYIKNFYELSDSTKRYLEDGTLPFNPDSKRIIYNWPIIKEDDRIKVDACFHGVEIRDPWIDEGVAEAKKRYLRIISYEPQTIDDPHHLYYDYWTRINIYTTDFF